MSSCIGIPEELIFETTLQNYIPSDDWNQTEETPSVETQNKVTKTLIKVTFFKHQECGASLPENLFENNATTRCPCCSKTASKVNFSSHNSMFYETLPSPRTAPVDNINNSKLRIKEIHSTIHNYLNAAQEDFKISNYEKAIS